MKKSLVSSSVACFTILLSLVTGCNNNVNQVSSAVNSPICESKYKPFDGFTAKAFFLQNGLELKIDSTCTNFNTPIITLPPISVKKDYYVVIFNIKPNKDRVGIESSTLDSNGHYQVSVALNTFDEINQADAISEALQRLLRYDLAFDTKIQLNQVQPDGGVRIQPGDNSSTTKSFNHFTLKSLK